MLFRKKSTTSFGATTTSSSSSSTSSNGASNAVGTTTTKCIPYKKSNHLFHSGNKILVHRAPIMMGLSTTLSNGSSNCTSSTTSTTTTIKSSNKVLMGFQRPMLGRRAYSKHADIALQQSSLGMKRRMDGMSKLLARAGRGLSYQLPNTQQPKTKSSSDTESDNDDDDEDDSPRVDAPYEPLLLWKSPHNGGTPKGLPSQTVQELRPDEYGVEEMVTVLKPAPLELYSKQDVYVPAPVARILRPHQREGVQFLYECVMGLKDYKGRGVILADDMGLGKTLQSVALIYTLLCTGITARDGPTAKRVIIVCPCSLVKNWDNEFIKWLGPGVVKTLALAEGDKKTIEKNIDCFARLKLFNVLIASYECIRTHIKLLSKHKECCDLLVCDEAHRLKNSDNQTSRALNSLPVQRRVLLTGTPMQNDLTEFYAMVDFTNPGILGTPEEFRRRMMFPILRGREPDATEAQKRKMMDLQNDLSTIVEDFILRRVNTLNAEHLPPKLVQVVCCNLTDIQQNMYNHLITSKDMQHVMDGKQVNCLASIQLLMKLCNHPSLVCDDDPVAAGNGKVGNAKRAVATKQIKYNEDEKESTAAPGADGISRFLPYAGGGGGGRNGPVHPEWSGKMYVLYRLMKEMRKPGNGNDKIVIISNYTQTLDLIGRMCRENNWGFCRLDGSVTMKKRQSMVDDFNDPGSSLIAFLLSSKAGGCGLNLIGGNRLVLFDPDWNPAVDKQAAARCWRDGQKKRCFTYRFLATGTVEEKIFQRQLSKEGLQSVVDDKEQVNALSTKDLKNLFKLRVGTPSDTHDKLQCQRCAIIHDTAEVEAQQVLPKKLNECRKLLDEITANPDATYFLSPLDATMYNRTKEQYEALVKQPMDFETIRKKLDQPPGSPSAYNAPSTFSKDVNRIFGNVAKVWDDGEEIADASKRLQTIWLEKWTDLVPVLMTMKADDTDDKPNDTSDDPVDKLLLNCVSNDNERGEDYQEQIGMPDEENMRLWSHHYNTDTVDDPIFRAAMRGTDNVSFVFGLEVTWSNIRARQEAEEEAEAAKAFECQQVDDDDENGDDEGENESVSGDTDSVNASNEKGKASPLQTTDKTKTSELSDSDEDDENDDGEDLKSFIEEDDDSNSESEHDEKNHDHNVEITPKNNKRSVAAVVVQQQSTTTQQTDSSTPCCEAEIVLDSSPEMVVVVDTSPESSVTSGAEAVAAAVHTNDDHTVDDYGCSITSSSNNKENIATPTEEVVVQEISSKATATEWACTTCTLVNKKSSRKCSVCGSRKPQCTQSPPPPSSLSFTITSGGGGRKKKRSIAELHS